MSCLEIEHGNINASELNSLMKSADSVICTNGFNEGEENYELNNVSVKLHSRHLFRINLYKVR